MKFLLKAYYFIEFFGVYLWELTKSNFIVAFESLRIHLTIKPGFVRVPLDCQLDDEILLFANLLTMTPGTITVDLSDDRKILYAHVLFVSDAEQVRAELKTVIERRVQRLFI